MARGVKSRVRPRFIDEKHRITLPPDVIDAMDLRPGDQVTIEISANEIVVKPFPPRK